MVPSFLSPSDFWELSLSELYLVTQNTKMKLWQDYYNEVTWNRILAADISKVLAGKQFDPITNYLPPNPRSSQRRTMEEIEMTLMAWANNGTE